MKNKKLLYIFTYILSINTILKIIVLIIYPFLSIHIDDIITIIIINFYFINNLIYTYSYYLFIIITISYLTAFFPFFRFFNNNFINFIFNFIFNFTILGSLIWIFTYLYYGHNFIPFYGHVCTTNFDNLINTTINESCCTFIKNNSDAFIYVIVEKDYLVNIRSILLSKSNPYIDLNIENIQQLSFLYFSQNHTLHYTSELWDWDSIAYYIKVIHNSFWISLIIRKFF